MIEFDKNGKEKLRRLLSLTRKAVQDYDLIKDGDKVCVGISGGKDSLALLATLANLRRFYPKKFELQAVTVSLGFKEMDFSPVKEFCEALEVPYMIVESDIAEIVFDIRKEQNPCALCANLRRGALNDHAGRLGCNVVALGHHKDDVIETSLLSLFEEKDVRQFAKAASVPVVTNPCPMDKASSRAEIKDLIYTLEQDNKFLRSNIFGAVKRDIWDRSL